MIGCFLHWRIYTMDLYGMWAYNWEPLSKPAGHAVALRIVYLLSLIYFVKLERGLHAEHEFHVSICKEAAVQYNNCRKLTVTDRKVPCSLSAIIQKLQRVQLGCLDGHRVHFSNLSDWHQLSFIQPYTDLLSAMNINQELLTLVWGVWKYAID